MKFNKIRLKYEYILQELKDKFLRQWTLLSSKGQWTLLISMIGCCLVLFYLMIFYPLHHWSSNNEKRMQQNYEDLVYVEKNIAEVKKNQSFAMDPMQAIIQEGKKFDITYLKVQPSQQNISIWINEIAYQTLVSWLLQLYKKAGLHVNQIKIERQDDGIVKVFVILER